MIKGIGIDIIELSRIQNILMRQKKFVDRVLTPKERRKFEELSAVRKVEFLAGRFAAKKHFQKQMERVLVRNCHFKILKLTMTAQENHVLQSLKSGPIYPFHIVEIMP